MGVRLDDEGILKRALKGAFALIFKTDPHASQHQPILRVTDLPVGLLVADAAGLASHGNMRLCCRAMSEWCELALQQLEEMVSLSWSQH